MILFIINVQLKLTTEGTERDSLYHKGGKNLN